MKAQIYGEKMLFLLQDQNIATRSKEREIDHHPYLVMFVPGNKNELVQCMSITSLSNYELNYELPLITFGSQVSYLSTSNIYSFGSRSFRADNYKGVLGSEIPGFSADDFIQLAMDLYLMQKIPGAVSGRCIEIKNRYIEYLKAFYKLYKVTEKYPDFANIKSGYESHDLQEHINKVEESKKEDLKLDTSTVFGKAIAVAVHKEEEQKKVASTPVKKSSGDPFGFSKDKLKLLRTSSCHINKWTDVELILFVQGYEKLGRQEFFKLCAISSSVGALYQKYKRAREEYDKRNL